MYLYYLQNVKWEKSLPITVQNDVEHAFGVSPILDTVERI